MTITELKAELAKREADARVARKHRDEAAARVWSPENERAYKDADAWVVTCAERERVARVRVIEAVAA